jgi:inhibitor of KinA
MEPQFKAIADHAVLVTFAQDISAQAPAMVLGLDAAIRVRRSDG